MSYPAENVLTAALTVLALALLAISLRAWRHARTPRLLLLAAAFALFLVKGLVLSVGLFGSGAWEQRFLVVALALDLAALVLFYAAVVWRRGGE